MIPYSNTHNAEYTNVAWTSIVIWMSIVNNICKIIGTLNINCIVNLYTKSYNQLVYIQQASENKHEIDIIDNLHVVQVGISTGSIIILFLLFLTIVSNANVKISIVTIFFTMIVITVQQFTSIYYLFELEMSKVFNFVEIILFLILITSLLISLFDSLWIALYSIIFVIMYTIFIIKEGSLKDIRIKGLILTEHIRWQDKYSNILDISNMMAVIFIFIMLLIFARNTKIWTIKSQNTSSHISPVNASNISIPINKLFFIKDNSIVVQETNEFKNTDYLFIINQLNQVVMYTLNAPNGIIVGLYDKNRINLHLSEHVILNITTGFNDNMWSSKITDKQIKLHDGTTTISGPSMGNLVSISFGKTSLQSFKIGDQQSPLPCDEYELTANLSTLAQPSSINAVSIDIYNDANNKLKIYQLYYPGTDILIGEGNDLQSICFNLSAEINEKPIFQLINGNIMYLSPLTKEYVYIDSIYNLNLCNIFFNFY